MAFAGASGTGRPPIGGRPGAGRLAQCAVLAAVGAVRRMHAMAAGTRRDGGFGRGSGRRCCSLRCCFFAALLPVLLAMVPGAWVPTRWSDFGFWAALGKSAAARVDAWFALPPQHKDIAVKWLLLEQGAVPAGCLFALRRPPAPRNEKAVEA